MVQAYYSMKYGEYLKHAHRVQGHWHTDDTRLTEDSLITLKVTAEDHVHDYLERQPGVQLGSATSSNPHPLVRRRGL